MEHYLLEHGQEYDLTTTFGHLEFRPAGNVTVDAVWARGKGLHIKGDDVVELDISIRVSAINVVSHLPEGAIDERKEAHRAQMSQRNEMQKLIDAANETPGPITPGNFE